MGLRNSKQSMEITAAVGADKKNGHVNGKAGHEEVNEEKITMNGDADKIIPNGDLADKLKAVELVEEEKKDTEPENENKESDGDAENENKDNNETKEHAEDKKATSIKTKVKNLKNRSLSFLKKKPKAADTNQDGATPAEGGEAEAAPVAVAETEAAVAETDVPVAAEETTEKTEEVTPEVKEVPIVPEGVEEPKVEAETVTEVVAETKRDD